jgi:NitT/TauT family transport system substrate-binding protein
MIGRHFITLACILGVLGGVFVGILGGTISPLAHAAEPALLRLGLFVAGTASWEMETVQRTQSLDGTAVTLAVTPLANPEAGKIALLGGSVDAIVADWLWAARARANGDAVVFLPYSGAVGALVARPDSGIITLSDLAGKRLGIAGGPLDKNWLILKAAAAAQGIDLEQNAQVMFGAPPLLSAHLADGGIDAVLTFWHFAARLNGQGFPTVSTVEQMATALLPAPDSAAGTPAPQPPWLGYVVRQDWANAHPAALRAFYQGALDARRLLHDDPASWDAVALKGDSSADAATRAALRKGWENGLPQPWGRREQQHCAALFSLLHLLGGDALTGGAQSLDLDLFWPVTLDDNLRFIISVVGSVHGGPSVE